MLPAADVLLAETDELVEPLAVVPVAALLDDDELELLELDEPLLVLEPLPLEVELPVLPADPAGLAGVPEVDAVVAAGVAPAAVVVAAVATGSGWPEVMFPVVVPAPIGAPAEMLPLPKPPTWAAAPATYETLRTPRLAMVEKTFVEVLTRQTPLREFVLLGCPHA